MTERSATLKKLQTLLPVFLLVLAVALLYGRFLQNPIVFDDEPFFMNDALDYYLKFHFALRWLSYATIAWTTQLLGLDLIWLRLGNLLLHAANAALLYVFLKNLFETILPAKNEKALSYQWLAFFGALWFALNPIAVYATGYLIERSTLLATLFALLCLLSFQKGLLQGKKGWLIAATLFYFLSVFSKEHAVLLPAVILAMTLLHESPSTDLLKKIALPFSLFALIAVTVVLLRKNVIASPYELNAAQMLQQLPQMQHAYLLSVMTQCLLFFKYLFLWLVPSPAWISIDMREPFAANIFDWRYLLASAGFLAYGAFSLWLLLQRGRKGLAGFALIFPWLLFATELSTVRIQEPFVLYRSYLWMIAFPALLPLVFCKMDYKSAITVLLGCCLTLAPLAVDRLNSFRSPLALWDDAAALAAKQPQLLGMVRIYHNRGIALSRAGLLIDAIKDYDRVIALDPKYSFAYNDRGAAYYYLKRYPEALSDFNKTIELNPSYARPYYGKGMTFRDLGNQAEARDNFSKSCELGFASACKEINSSAH